MKIAFTICSNNYLAQAKTLGDSIRMMNPDYNFIIGLTDVLTDEINYEKEIGHTIIPVADIGIPDMNCLWEKYDIIEFNTNVKPFYFTYFINKYKNLKYIYYLDPDIVLFGDLKYIEDEFISNGNVLLTPHILTPIPLDGKSPGENNFLNYGIYNLGFLGLKNSPFNTCLIKWWSERTFKLGFNKPEKGYFVDQLWFNLVPIFFENVIISKNPGLNMAPWNLHERFLSGNFNEYYVNERVKLIFYHFSNYKYNNSDSISRHYTRYNFNTNPELKKIYENYSRHLFLNGIKKLVLIECKYMKLKHLYIINEQRRRNKGSFISIIKYNLKKILPEKVTRIINLIRH